LGVEKRIILFYILLTAACLGQDIKQTHAYYLGEYDYGGFSMRVILAMVVEEGDSTFAVQIEREDLGKSVVFTYMQIMELLVGYHTINEDVSSPKIKNKLLPIVSHYRYEGFKDGAYIEKAFSDGVYMWWIISNGKDSYTIKDQDTMLRMLNKVVETIETLKN